MPPSSSLSPALRRLAPTQTATFAALVRMVKTSAPLRPAGVEVYPRAMHDTAVAATPSAKAASSNDGLVGYGYFSHSSPLPWASAATSSQSLVSRMDPSTITQRSQALQQLVASRVVFVSLLAVAGIEILHNATICRFDVLTFRETNHIPVLIARLRWGLGTERL